jgi:hypothetical protein
MRPCRPAATATLCLLLGLAPAHAWTEPARGSATRADLMDAIRPIAEWNLGAPVEFVVDDLRVAGDVAFASLWAQRPGGGAIDMQRAPMVQRGDYDPETIDGPTMQALLQRSGRMWVAVTYAIGPTDVWWAWDGFCPIWAAVLPEVCAR